MINLLLVASLMDIVPHLKTVLPEDLTTKRITFIPTASLPEYITFYVKAAKKCLQQLGLIVEELDISTASASQIKTTIAQNEFLYVAGGNTFFLLQELKRTGTDKLIQQHINAGKLYIGESAGAIILAPDISYVQGMDNPKKGPKLKDFNGLHAINFYPVPHYKNFPYKKRVERIISHYGSTHELALLTNQQVILVQGQKRQLK